MCMLFISLFRYKYVHDKHAMLILTLHSDIHSAVPGSSMDCMGGFTGVYSCCTPLDVHDHKTHLITDYNSLRTEPLYSGIKFHTIQVQCISFIDGGHSSDYWRPED